MRKKTGNTQFLQQSVLDRLVSDRSYEQTVQRSRNAMIADIKESVRKDLERLLNTRRRCGEAKRIEPELDGTVAHYGVPDFTGATFANENERETLRDYIQKIVEQFEPRFKKVRVSELSEQSDLDRTVRYRIEAELNVEPAVKPILFDSTVDPVSRRLNIEEEARG